MTRNPDRLVLFTDAVVAIAVTLLILPLVEVVNEFQAEGHDAQSVITEHRQQIYSFLLSFLVIARFWLVHHRIFEHVRAYNTRLIQLNMVWLLFIVILPFPTEIAGAFASDQFVAGLYIGTILALSICHTGLTLLIRNHSELEEPDNPVTGTEVSGSLIFLGLMLVAFLLATLIPGVGFYALFVLFLSSVIAKLLKLYRPAQNPQ